MSRERFKARDKVTNKMSKNGLIQHNVATGEDRRISNREGEFDIRADSQFDIAKQRSIHNFSNLTNTRFAENSTNNIPANKPHMNTIRLQSETQRNTILSQSEPEQNREIDQRYSDIRHPQIEQDNPQKLDYLSTHQFDNTITPQQEINPSTLTQNSLNHQLHATSGNQQTASNNYSQNTVQNITREQKKTTAAPS